MRDDRRALRPAVIADEPTGRVYEMDVALDAHELKPAPGYLLEPWVRVAERDDLMLSAGIAVSQRNEGDVA